ncbi:hypothetical protein GGF38_005323, partial [Coemansia sp. RSA 25]
LEHQFADQDHDDREAGFADLPNDELMPPLLGLGGPALMPGLVIHAGPLDAAPRRHRPEADNQAPAQEPEPAQRVGLFGRLMGNWRVANAGQAPPDPQPGPVPDAPHQPRPTSAASSDAAAAGAPQTTTPPPEAGRGP